MNIKVSQEAADWFIKEYDIEGKASLRFFVRYGGVGGNVPGFSLGVSLEEPENIHTSTTVQDVLFFIEEKDAWYFEEKDLYITYDAETDEPQFTFQT